LGSLIEGEDGEEKQIEKINIQNFKTKDTS